MKIINHRLCDDNGKSYEWFPKHGNTMNPYYIWSPHHGETMNPQYLIMHFTAGRSAESTIEWFLNPSSEVSAHLVIGRDGSITQLVPFDTIAWHAGRSSWKGLEGMNKYSIGIELDNMGELTLKTDGYHPWFQAPPVPEDQVLKNTPHRFNRNTPRNWHRYTEKQLESAFKVALLLVETYQLKEILGHDDIAWPAGRKSDPGPAFPMDKLRAAQVYPHIQTPATETYQVVVESLNIRQGPDRDHNTVGDPLPKGTRLQILEVSDDNPRWKKVDVLDDDRVGWVNTAPVNSPPTLEKVAS